MNFHLELRKSSCRKELKRRTGRSLDILEVRRHELTAACSPNVGTMPHPVLPRRGPHLHPRPGGAVYRLDGHTGRRDRAACLRRYKPSIARKRAFKRKGATAMKKYQLTGQPIYVGETYNHNGDLYRVESFDEGYTEPKVTLRRIKDGTIFDVEAPALFLTPTGVQLLWPREVNRFCSTLEQAV